MTEMIVTYTEAPLAYDGFGTRTVALVATARNGPVRKVETPAEHLDWQRQRYWSGNYLCVADGEEWGRVKHLTEPLTGQERVMAAGPFLLAALCEALPELDWSACPGVVQRIKDAIALAGG